MARRCIGKALKVTAGIYQKNLSNYADTVLEYAKHLESLRKGNPSNSKWSKMAPRYSDNVEGTIMK